MDKKRKKKVEGLGDKVAKVTEALKIDKVVKFVFGEDCECDKRQAYLNTIGLKPISCFNEKTYNTWKNVRTQLKGSIKKHEQDIILDNYKQLFGVDNSKLCKTCSGTGKVFIKMISQINEVFNSYDSSR